MDMMELDDFAKGGAGVNERAGIKEVILAVSVVLGGLNPIWQPNSENKHLPHLNKLHNFPQQTPSNNDSTLFLSSLSSDSFCCSPPKPIWPSLPLTAMANLPLIHLHAALTRSPRLWRGSGALSQHGERRRHLYYRGEGKLTKPWRQTE